MAQLNNKNHPIVQLQATSDYLEPRVAKLETGLEMLTKDVSNLALIVRDQGNAIEEQIKQLAVDVTRAAAPQKTDWQTLIALVMLVMAIGSAVFWPLNQTAHENKTSLESLEQKFEEHNKLELHPVGKALLGRLEAQLQDHVVLNRRDDDQQNLALARQIDLLTERINARLNKLEENDADRNKTDLTELKALRYKMFLYRMAPLEETDENASK